MRKKYRVLGIGDACIDLIVPVGDDFLKQVNGEKGGWEEIDFESLNRLLVACKTDPEVSTGGSCANTIKGLACLGERCAFLSAIGEDSLGDYFGEYMQRLGVVGLLRKMGRPTSRVLSLVTPDGERTMRFYGGASEALSEEFLDEEEFRGIKHFHVDAYSLRKGNLVKRAMQMAHEAQAKISIDLSSGEIVQLYHQELLEILPQYVDIVFANEREATALTGLERHESCQHLQKLCPIAVVLLGKEGCLVGHQEEIFHSPGFPAKVVDSTGAGDLFASGFLYGYLQGYPLTKCAQLGNRLGSAVVEVKGTELPPERWQLIRKELL